MKFFVIMSLSLFMSNSFAVHSDEKLRLIHAESLEREILDGEIIQRIIGNVKFQQDLTTISCDVAEQIVNRGEFTLLGNVNIYDKEQHLQADSLFIYEKEKLQVARGHVINITEKDTTYADKVTYFQSENKFESNGNVKIRNIERNSALTGEAAVYFKNEDDAIIWGSPSFVKYDSVGFEATRINADTLKTFENGDSTIAQGNVEILQEGGVSKCGRAEYFPNRDKIYLYDEPVIEQKNQHIRGDSIQIFLEDSKLAQVLVVRNAMAVSDADTLNKGSLENKLTGQQMNFFFVDNKLNKVEIEHQATSIYHIIEEEKYKGANEVSGDKITIEFDGNTAKRVLVVSEPDLAAGKFLPPN